MVVLAIESATVTASVALADEDGVLAQFTVARGRRHVETLVPTIAFVCRSAGVAVGDLCGVAVDIGPGLFTGLRVGISTAKAMGLALDVPLYGATSLEILARAVACSGLVRDSDVMAVVDARRGEVFTARFALTGDAGIEDCVTPLGHEDVMAPADLAALLARGEGAGAGDVVLAGDGAQRYAAVLSDGRGAVLAGDMWGSPPAGVLARLGVARIAAGAGVDPGALAPKYLRAADTRINWQTRAVAHPVS